MPYIRGVWLVVCGVEPVRSDGGVACPLAAVAGAAEDLAVVGVEG